MEKFWLKNYPNTVPAEINPDRYESLVDFFLQTVKEFKHHPALYNMGAQLTYRQLEKKTRAFAAYVQKHLGLKKGDRIAIMLPNCIQYMIAMLGALRAGLVVVNCNPLYTPRELEHQLNDAGAETLVVLANMMNTVEEVIHRTIVKNIIVTEIGDMFNPIKGFLVNLIARKIKKLVPAYNKKNTISFRKLMCKGRWTKLDDVALFNSDLAFLQYTGGTTGVTKGAMLTHRNILSNVEQAYAWMSQAHLEPGKEVIITALPLYHIFSLTVNTFCFMKIGVKNILITNPREIIHLIQELERHRFTIMAGVNTLFKALLRHKRFLKLDFSSIKIALGGGMAVHRSVAELWYEITNTVLLEAYGLTEASPAVSCNPLNIKKYTGSIGLPFSSTEIKIVDDEGSELPMGECGELWVRGPQVMLGYWNNPEETQKVLTPDGWLKTGDVVKIDGQGYLYLVDRKKDIIVVSGYNVYPNEVEEAIAEHPDVLEVAVIGEPSDKTGEIVKAVVVRKNPSLTREALFAFCRERLTHYKIPKKFEFCDELPKTNVGKILRRALREERFRTKHIGSPSNSNNES